MADMKDVIERLVERTYEQRVPWETTIGEDVFTATIGDMSVMVSSQMLRRPRPEPLSLRIAVFDEGRNEIASFEASRYSTRDYQNLYSLWQAAKMIATGAHPRLDDFLNALDSTPEISPAERVGRGLGRAIKER